MCNLDARSVHTVPPPVNWIFNHCRWTIYGQTNVHTQSKSIRMILRLITTNFNSFVCGDGRWQRLFSRAHFYFRSFCIAVKYHSFSHQRWLLFIFDELQFISSSIIWMFTRSLIVLVLFLIFWNEYFVISALSPNKCTCARFRNYRQYIDTHTRTLKPARNLISWQKFRLCCIVSCLSVVWDVNANYYNRISMYIFSYYICKQWSKCRWYSSCLLYGPTCLHSNCVNICSTKCLFSWLVRYS